MVRRRPARRGGLRRGAAGRPASTAGAGTRRSAAPPGAARRGEERRPVDRHARARAARPSARTSGVRLGPPHRSGGARGRTVAPPVRQSLGHRGQHAARGRAPGTSSTLLRRRACAPRRRTAPAARTADPVVGRAQLLGSAAIRPVTVDDQRNGRRRGRSAPRDHRRNSSSIGSISGEWNAWLTAQPLGARTPRRARPRRARRPRPRRRRPPPTEGPLTAAIATRRRTARRAAAATSSSAACDRHHRPAGRQRLHQPAPRARPGAPRRRATARPATCAAASSPTECPASEVGRDAPGLQQPEQRHLDREQRRLGVRRSGPAGRAGREQHLAQRPVQMRVEPGAHRVERLGEHREGAAYSSRAHAGPLAALAGEQEGQPARPRQPTGDPRRDRQPARLGRARRSAGPAARRGRRPEHHRPVLERGPGGGQRVGRRRRGDGRAGRSTWAAQPAGLGAAARPPSCADSSHGSDRAAWRRSATVGGRLLARGACSRITCALVPLTPNADTPARRGRPVSGQARASVSSSTAPADQSTCGVGSSDVQGPRAGCRAASPAPS